MSRLPSRAITDDAARPPLKLLVHENLGGTVYQMLCDGLIKGQFRPGDRLKIRDIAEQLGTSVTPVRDALLRLVQDQALTMRSARDTRVPLMTAKDYAEIRAIRLRLEGLAAETAAGLATPAQIGLLEDVLRRNEEAIARQDRNGATELNQIFHFQLASIAGLPILQNILSRLWMRMGPMIAEVYEASGRDMIDYHYPIVEAIRRHDGPAAAAAMRDDIVKGGHAIGERLDQAVATEMPDIAPD